MRKLILPLIVLLMAISASPILAQPNTAEHNRQQILNDRKENLQERKELKIDKAKERIASKEAHLKERLEKKYEKMASKEAAFKDKWEDRLKQWEEKRASKAAHLKKRLDVFKDKRKAQIAERVDKNLNQVNKNRTNAFMNQLDAMNNLSEKLSTRIASANGKNTASASAALSQANSAIVAAKTAVTTQAGKDYTVTVFSESTIASDVKKVRDQLFTDLKTLHTTVKSAHDALALAVKAVVALGGTN